MAKSSIQGPGKKLCSQGRAGGMGRRAVWGDAHRCQLPSSIAHPPESFVLPPIPESLVVNLGGADTDGVVPVGRFAPHLGEEELQGPLVDSGVCGCSLTDWGEKREGKKMYSAFFSFLSRSKARECCAGLHEPLGSSSDHHWCVPGPSWPPAWLREGAESGHHGMGSQRQKQIQAKSPPLCRFFLPPSAHRRRCRRCSRRCRR